MLKKFNQPRCYEYNLYCFLISAKNKAPNSQISKLYLTETFILVIKRGQYVHDGIRHITCHFTSFNHFRDL